MFKKKPNLLRWPPDLPSIKPKVKKKYEHHVLVSSKDREVPYDQLRDLAIGVLSNDEKSVEEFAEFFVPVFQLDFKSESAAKEVEKTLSKATNGITVEREKQEVLNIEKEGYVDA